MLHRLNMKQQLLVMGTVTTLLFIPAGIFSVVAISNLAFSVNEGAEVHVPLTRNLGMADMMHDGIRALVLESSLARLNEDAARIDEVGEEINEYAEKMNSYIGETAKLALPEKMLGDLSKAQDAVKAYGLSAVKTWQVTKQGSALERAESMKEFNDQFEIVEEKLGSTGDELAEYSKQQLMQAEENAKNADMWVKFIVLASILLSGGVSFFLSRASTGKLKNSIGELQKLMKSLLVNSGQVGADSVVVSDSTVQLGTAIEESVASMTEMTAMLTQTADSAAACFKASEQGKDEALKGQEVVERLVESVQTIESSQADLAEMKELMSEISAKTQIINEIVSETRLLSFNASIEAARAGVHGRGFAVVAEEVGKLAVISGKASQDIRTLLDDSTKKVEKVVTVTKERVAAGVLSSQECHRAIDAMRQSLHKISDAVQSISHATKEQKTGVQQVNLAILEIERVNAKNSTAAESLANQANTLRSKVDGSAQQVQSIAEFAGAVAQELTLQVSTEADTVSRKVNVGIKNSSHSVASIDPSQDSNAHKTRGSRADKRFDEVA